MPPPSFRPVSVLGVPLPQLLASVYNCYCESSPPLGHRGSKKFGHKIWQVVRDVTQLGGGTLYNSESMQVGCDTTPFGCESMPFGRERYRER